VEKNGSGNCPVFEKERYWAIVNHVVEVDLIDRQKECAQYLVHSEHMAHFRMPMNSPP